MLTAFYVHMINIRSTYDLHAIYIDYCWMFVGVNIVSFFKMFDCIGIGSFIVAAIGLKIRIGRFHGIVHCLQWGTLRTTATCGSAKSGPEFRCPNSPGFCCILWASKSVYYIADHLMPEQSLLLFCSRLQKEHKYLRRLTIGKF